MPQGYTSRDVAADANQVKKNKQSMADLKLRRLTELNNRLREDLERDRIPISQASKRFVFPLGAAIELYNGISANRIPLSIIGYTSSTKDFMVPSVWGQVDKKDDPYAPQQSGGCCVVM